MRVPPGGEGGGGREAEARLQCSGGLLPPRRSCLRRRTGGLRAVSPTPGGRRKGRAQEERPEAAQCGRAGSRRRA